MPEACSLDIEKLIDKFAEKKQGSANLKFEVLLLDPIIQFWFFGKFIFVDFVNQYSLR